MLFYNNRSGGLVYGKAIDLDSGRKVSLPPDLANLPEDDLLMAHTTSEDYATGIIALPEGPIMVSSHPILDNQWNGPIHGTLIVGRHLDEARVDELGWLRTLEVLMNLTENSAKYMGDEISPEIEIGWRRNGDETAFFVKDNGIGIEAAQREKVFDLFYKLGPSTVGSGVGLAIVKRIVEFHGGRIWIESEEGKGTTVLFTLPMAED